MLFFKKIFKNLTIDDLPTLMPDISKLRHEARILLIDDQGFSHKESLSSAGFNIQVNPRWNSIRDVEPYTVVVSDNQGVANDLGENCDGLYMLNQARKIYPDKFFALYSGNMIELRDKNISGLPVRTKGDDPEKWTTMFDEALLSCYNPRNSWNKIYRLLYEQNISEKEIRLVQHYFVKSILDEKEFNLPNRSLNEIDNQTLSLIIRLASLAISAIKLIQTI